MNSKLPPAIEILGRLVKAGLLSPEVRPYAERSVRQAGKQDPGVQGSPSLWAGILDPPDAGAVGGGRFVVLQPVPIDGPMVDGGADIARPAAQVTDKEKEETKDGVEDGEASAGMDVLARLKAGHAARAEDPDFGLLLDDYRPAEPAVADLKRDDDRQREERQRAETEKLEEMKRLEQERQKQQER